MYTNEAQIFANTFLLCLVVSSVINALSVGTDGPKIYTDEAQIFTNTFLLRLVVSSLINALSVGTDGPQTVSYTHLDVYKRQPYTQSSNGLVSCHG